MTDMLRLRLFALTGCVLIVSFQAVQPRKQWVSLGWNSVYCAVNLYHINLLLQERPRRLQQERRKAIGLESLAIVEQPRLLMTCWFRPNS